jgi:hypothetical protein
MNSRATQTKSLRDSGAVPIAPDPTSNPGDPDVDCAGKGSVRDRAAASMAPPAVSAGIPAADPRAVMLAHLSADMGAAATAGDLPLVRFLNDTVARFLATLGQEGPGSNVVDLATERAKRG